MKDKVICNRCFGEFDSAFERCPICGMPAGRSKRIYSYFKTCESKGIKPSFEYLLYKFDLPIAAAEQLTRQYLNDLKHKENDQKSNVTLKKIKVEKRKK